MEKLEKDSISFVDWVSFLIHLSFAHLFFFTIFPPRCCLYIVLYCNNFYGYIATLLLLNSEKQTNNFLKDFLRMIFELLKKNSFNKEGGEGTDSVRIQNVAFVKETKPKPIAFRPAFSSDRVLVCHVLIFVSFSVKINGRRERTKEKQPLYSESLLIVKTIFFTFSSFIILYKRVVVKFFCLRKCCVFIPIFY